MVEQNRIASHICRQLCEGDNRAAPCCHEAGNRKMAYGARKKEKLKKGKKEKKKEKKNEQQQKRAKQEQKKFQQRTTIIQYVCKLISLQNHLAYLFIHLCPNSKHKWSLPNLWGASLHCLKYLEHTSPEHNLKISVNRALYNWIFECYDN